MEKKEDIYIELILLKRCTGEELSQGELQQLSIWLQSSQKHIDYYQQMQSFPYKEDEHIPANMDGALERFLSNIQKYNASKSTVSLQRAALLVIKSCRFIDIHFIHSFN